MVDLGDPLPDLAVDVRDLAGVLAAAGAVTLTLTLPDGSSTTPAVSSPSTGRYVATYVTVQAGRHHGRWVATGANASTYSQDWDVRPADGGGIVSVRDVKAFLGMTAVDTSEDEELRLYIEATTAIVEAEVGAVVRQTRSDIVAGTDELWLPVRPVLSLTSVVPVWTGGITPAVADLTVELGTGHVYRTDGLALGVSSPWTVTYTVGRVVIPGNITLAALMIVGHLWDTQRGPADLPLAVDVEPAVPGFAIPRRALELLRPHKMLGGVA